MKKAHNRIPRPQRNCLPKDKRKVLRNKTVLLGVTGGVAAYKAVDLIRRLRDEAASVTVVMTGAARHFITPLSLEVASQNKVYSDLFTDPLSHISLPAQADIMIVAPATANIIGKFAGGIADDMLSTCLLTFQGKVIIAPSMNWRMYENPVVQENLQALRSRGVIQSGPEKGSLACGEEGAGRMSDIPDIIELTKSALSVKDLVTERIIVTAGPTREHLDQFRYISNRSSGKMGYALARAALRRGAEVTLISGPSSLKCPKGARFCPVETADEMHSAVQTEIPSASVLVMAAAVSDFRPAIKAPGKIWKSDRMVLTLQMTPDILAEIGGKKDRPFVIGFTAESGPDIGRARKKMQEKNMDMVVFNDISETGAGFDVDTNKVVIIDNDTEISLPLMSKDAVADAILDRFVEKKA
jgi:phosphopantothenoylcysteine decarboxylase/phosphopantothenate--cysteine ligase